VGRKNGDPLLGGQAVIEGVMMRFGGSIATAVRRADGSVVVRTEAYAPLAERHPWLAWPILRGAVGLVEMLAKGIASLNFSAEMAMEDEGPRKGGEKGRNTALGLTLAFSLLAGLALFFALPLWLATALFNVDQQPLLFNLASGIVRVTIFLGYVGALSFMKDIRRLFQYHGAEHKTVATKEQGAALTVAECRLRSRFHPRCGTSFLLVVMVSAILLFAILDTILIGAFGRLTLPLRLATHLPLIPLVMGISYEVIRFSARHIESWAGRWIVAPGLWLQRITTLEPDDAQLEVAIAALRAALGESRPVDALEQAVTAQPISVN
jgi:uncharacterized protein YqhQ